MSRSHRSPLTLTLLSSSSKEDPTLQKPLFIWSGQGCRQILTPLKHPSLYRTIDGKLVDVSAQTHHKYTSTIVCQDHYPPPLLSLHKGMVFWVGCIQELSCLVEKGSVAMTLPHEPVKGSVVLQRGGAPPLYVIPQGRLVTLPKDQTSEGLLLYRPHLLMHLVHFHLDTTETEAFTKWSLEFEEA